MSRLVALCTAVLLGLVGAVAVAAPASATPPEAPTITLVKSQSGGSGLIVNWSVVTPADGSTIASYEYSLDAGATATNVGLTNQYAITGLANGTTYSVTVRAVNNLGELGAWSAPVTGTPVAPLPKPRKMVGATFYWSFNNTGAKAGEKMGVGTIPAVKFTTAITDKAAVENNMLVTKTIDGIERKVKGAWAWVDSAGKSSDRVAVFRPTGYWPGHARIKVISTLGRQSLGTSGKKTLVGKDELNTTWSFDTARKLMLKVDGDSHRLKIYEDGKRIKNFGVSLGKKGWESRSGVKVISTYKLRTHTYTSTSLNITNPNEQYVLKDIPWNTRLTPTGEYMHSAPWAAGRIGYWNGSHGCTNLLTDDAKWVYENTIPGDVAVYTNAGKMMEVWNGPGGLWNFKWSKWLKMSATGEQSGANVPFTPSTTPVAPATPVS